MLGERKSQGYSAKTENLGGSQPVFVGTTELFPFTVMDLILTLAEDQLFEFVWSEGLLEKNA